MSLSENIKYFRRRAEEARTNAARATSPEVRRIHLELASRYSEREMAVRAAAGWGGAPSRAYADLSFSGVGQPRSV